MKMKRVMHAVKGNSIYHALMKARKHQSLLELNGSSYLVQGEERLDGGMIRVELEAV